MLENFGIALSREQMRNVLGGSNPRSIDSCKPLYSYECSINGGGNPEDQCCPGLTCKINGTGTGTICMDN
jgi:hypothetical protein